MDRLGSWPNPSAPFPNLLDSVRLSPSPLPIRAGITPRTTVTMVDHPTPATPDPRRIDVRAFNRDAWDAEVTRGNRWTLPVDADTVARARRGEWSIVLTPSRPVPREWFGDLVGARVLALASGGGQQGPILAAAGALVTVYDNSPAQLARDREVAVREGLAIETLEGDMRDLRALPDDSFDLVFHPCSTTFVPDVRPVWRECFRVLRPGGALLAGIVQTFAMCVDEEAEERGEIRLVHPAPYSDLTCRPAARLAAQLRDGEPLAFGHTMEDLVGGQLDVGFLLAGWMDDGWGGSHPIDRIAPAFVATRAIKPR